MQSAQAEVWSLSEKGSIGSCQELCEFYRQQVEEASKQKH